MTPLYRTFILFSLDFTYPILLWLFSYVYPFFPLLDILSKLFCFGMHFDLTWGTKYFSTYWYWCTILELSLFNIYIQIYVFIFIYLCIINFYNIFFFNFFIVPTKMLIPAETPKIFSIQACTIQYFIHHILE